MKILDALVVKLVDTKDLKSLPLAECQFESGRGHHLFYIYIIIVNTYGKWWCECNNYYTE